MQRNNSILYAILLALPILLAIPILSTLYNQPTILNPTSSSSSHWSLDADLKVVIPHDMILISSSLLWCPTAKSGTTTVYNILWQNNLTSTGGRCFPHCPMMATEQLRGWSIAKPPSFVIVRNPYDRLRSAFVNKILTDKIRIWEGKKNKSPFIKSFVKFVKYVELHPRQNHHWAPVSSRCLTGKSISGSDTTADDIQDNIFQYDYILKLEDNNLPQQLATIFQRAGIDLPAGIDTMPMNQNENKNYASSSSNNTTTVEEFYRQAALEGGVTMEELIAMVGRIYSDDIETFAYSFPLF